MRTSVFVGASLDGFIARKNGSFDFLSPSGEEPHGYDEFIQTVDVIVMGRNTFDVVLAFPQWPYADKRVVVLSARPIDLSGIAGTVEQMGGTPHEILANLERSGAAHAYVDGGITVQRFLAAGAIDRLVVTRVPVLIGEGIPLFGSLPHDIALRHVATQHYRTGIVKSEYEVLNRSTA